MAETSTPTPMTPDEQYLWDGTGTPSGALRDIETSLKQQAYSGEPLTLRRPGVPRRVWLSLAAAVVIAVVLALYVYRPATVYDGWRVASATRNAAIQPLRGKASNTIGCEVSTPAGGSATLQFKDQYSVTFQQGSRATVSGTPSVQLGEGEAIVKVPPAASAAELESGNLLCRVAPGTTASVSTSAGSTQVRVDSGWAEVSMGDQKVRLAATMACTVGPKSSTPWPPYRIKDGESAALVKRLDQVLYSKLDEKSAYVQLGEIVKTARPQDAAVLWNLLARVQEWQRDVVRNQLAKLLKEPPKGAAFDAVLKLDPQAMDAWWDAIIRQ